MIVLTVQSGYFDAGVVLRDGIVRTAAPILKYMRGWTRPKVFDYCARKGWRVIE